MALITQAMRDLLNKKNGIVYVGTVDSEGMPNISPRAVIEIGDDYLLWGDNFQNKTFSNLQQNALATVAMADEAAYRGYQLKGTIEFSASGPDYERVAQAFAAAGFGTPRQAVRLRVGTVYSLAPDAGSRNPMA